MNEEAKKALAELNDIADSAATGKMKLYKSFMSDDREITELEFDFRALTGFEFIRAMDSDTDGKANSFRMTDKQAMTLFCAAASKKSGVDQADIENGLCIEDAIKAVQLATVFFSASSRAGNVRITKG